jgi:NAD(P)-dependent dehydrogenase (short-subunit alcohol dehydrogenase family)
VELGLRDRVCLVTGSTAGIGLETARMLAEEGAKVVVSGRDPERVEAVRAEIGAALGIAGDLSAPEAAGELIARAEAGLGQVDCLVNNVGIAVQRRFDGLTEAD